MVDIVKENRAMIAAEFATLLEEKGLFWKKGWDAGGAMDPYNGLSNVPYRGINHFYLGMVAMGRGYKDPRWATFNQVKNNGWRLVDAKGMGVKVEYWYPFDVKEKKAVPWEQWRNDEDRKQNYQFRARPYTVFNAEHIDGMGEFPLLPENDIHPDKLVGILSKNMGVEILHDGGNRSFYRPKEDKIHLPEMKYFSSDYDYGATALHELAHATGAPHRLNRQMGSGFGSEAYAYEELVAEISSCFMSGNLAAGQTKEHIENHKAYVRGWVEMVRNAPERLVQAVRDAEKTADYMEMQAVVVPEKTYAEPKETSLEVEEAALSLPGQREREVEDRMAWKRSSVRPRGPRL